MAKPIGCTLVAPDLAAQGTRWRELAQRTPVERAELPNGMRLIFGAAPGVAETLEELVAIERECCAFATWTLSTDADKTILDITTDEAVPIVREMFGLYR